MAAEIHKKRVPPKVKAVNEVITNILYSIPGSLIASLIFVGVLWLFYRKRKADQHASILERLNNQIESFEASIHNYREETKNAFVGLNNRFDEINNRFDKVNNDIEKVQNEVNLLDKDLTLLTTEQEDLSGEIADIKSKYGKEDLSSILDQLKGR